MVSPRFQQIPANHKTFKTTSPRHHPTSRNRSIICSFRPHTDSNIMAIYMAWGCVHLQTHSHPHLPPLLIHPHKHITGQSGNGCIHHPPETLQHLHPQHLCSGTSKPTTPLLVITTSHPSQYYDCWRRFQLHPATCRPYLLLRLPPPYPP